MAGSLAIGGLASGLDTNSIISKLMEIERKPLLRLQEKQEQLYFRKEMIQEINRKALTVQQKAFDLTLQQAFQKKTSNSTNQSVLTGFVASSTAKEGNYEINVKQLSQVHKIASSRQNSIVSMDEDLGIKGGSFSINGETIQVEDGFSLNKIAKAINNSGAGVTANILDNTLTITSDKSGKAGEMVMEDLGTDSVLKDLGILKVGANNLASGATVVASSEQSGFPASNLIDGNPSTNWLAQNADKATPITPVTVTLDLGEEKHFNNVVLGQVGGLASPNYHSGDYMIEVSNDGINFFQVAQGSLEDESGSGQSVTFGGIDARFVRISILSEIEQGGEIESQGLSEISIFDKSYANELRSAQNAKFEVDGLNIERSTNRIDDVLEGVVINLQDTGLSYLSVEKDVENTVSIVAGFVKEYNSLMSAVYTKLTEEKATDDQLSSARDMESLKLLKMQGLLKRDTMLQDIQSSMKMMISGSVANMTLNDVGIEVKGFEGGYMTEEGKIGLLAFDPDKFRETLRAEPSKVESLFSNRGGITTAKENFTTDVSTKTHTLLNGRITDNVSVTVNGQKYTQVASTEHFSDDEKSLQYYLDHNTGKLTFNNIVAKNSQVDIRYSYISQDATKVSLEDVLIGTGNGGTTMFYLNNRYIQGGSKIYVGDDIYEEVADPSQFTASNQYYMDHDKGRITFYEAPQAGVPITANFSYLAGNSGIGYSLAEELKKMTGIGSLYQEEKSLDNQINDAAKGYKDLEARLKSKEDKLWAQYARLERAMSEITAQGQWLSSQLATMTSNSGK